MDAQAPPNDVHQDHIAKNNDFVRNYIEIVLLAFSQYGWFILFGAILTIIIWSNIEPKFRKWRQRLEEDRISAQIHKNPDSVLIQQEAMLSARRKLQEAHDAEAEKHKEKMSKKEEEMRQNKIADWERHQKGAGYRSKVNSHNSTTSDNQSTNTKKPKKPSLMPRDFNPLMGQGSSSGFRPARRGFSSGG